MVWREKSFWLWLQRGLGAGSGKLLPLLEYFGSPQKCFEAGEQAWRRWGNLTSQEMERFLFYTPSYGEALLSYTENLGQEVLTPQQRMYPRPLRYLMNPPGALFMQGKLPYFEGRPWIAIVGSRKASEKDCQAAYLLAAHLAEAGAVIVSGGAMGIDEAAHKGALEAGGETVCVMGCGLSYPYLTGQLSLRQEIARNGALLSEYPPDTPPLPMQFPVRNRLISGLSDGIVVISANEKSGSLVTARLALEQQRMVMVGNFAEEALAPGCEKLWKNGAPIVSSAEDVLALLYTRNSGSDGEENKGKEFREKTVLKNTVSVSGEKKSVRKTVELAEDQQGIPEEISKDAGILLAKIRAENSIQQISDLARELSMPVSKVLAAATELELSGYIRSYSGGRYGPA